MGMYDSFFSPSGKEFQLKNGDCALNEFKIGDEVNSHGYADGIYLEQDGFVVVYDGKFVASFNPNMIKDKWGDELDFKRVIQCKK